MDFSSYIKYIIAAVVIALAVAVHHFMPDSVVDKDVEIAAQEIVKDETGLSLPMVTKA